tara:strand:+ start:152 stop:370 length:219 start_codon:yes stop_codon:yes gene_type:complete
MLSKNKKHFIATKEIEFSNGSDILTAWIKRPSERHLNDYIYMFNGDIYDYKTYHHFKAKVNSLINEYNLTEI